MAAQLGIAAGVGRGHRLPHAAHGSDIPSITTALPLMIEMINKVTSNIVDRDSISLYELATIDAGADPDVVRAEITKIQTLRENLGHLPILSPIPFEAFLSLYQECPQALTVCDAFCSLRERDQAAILEYHSQHAAVSMEPVNDILVTMNPLLPEYPRPPAPVRRYPDALHRAELSLENCEGELGVELDIGVEEDPSIVTAIENSSIVASIITSPDCPELKCVMRLREVAHGSARIRETGNLQIFAYLPVHELLSRLPEASLFVTFDREAIEPDRNVVVAPLLYYRV
eukprot:TRINITY_DN3067_c0_g1_i1.p1 TRINITY_DN3067_c0_g1~~TRINITY_DN3067_c0_g1_i1.p1  ORF type:complete len:287 (-),score=3.09 TRINITY_DN3067_c0_g1_i1:20-880(-)